jgi:predicted transcriptional regulator
MPRTKMFSIAPEDKRSIAVTLKLTERENDLLTRYAAQLDSDKSYVAGKIFEAFVPQALASKNAAAAGTNKAAGGRKQQSEKQPPTAAA